jgi:hypothetical protein
MDWINPRRNFESFSIEPGRGLTVDFGDPSQSGTETIPTLAGGQVPKYIYVCIYGDHAGSDHGQFALGGTLPTDGASGTAGGWVLNTKRDCAQVVNCTGYTEISWVQGFGPGCKLTIYPLADF